TTGQVMVWCRIAHDRHSGALQLADERARVAAERIRLTNVQRIRDLLPTPSKQHGNPFEFLLDRTLMRPRDVIAFLNECLTHAVGKNRITWADLQRSELEYSKKRLLALRDEWKPTFPDIDKVFQLFRRCTIELTRGDLTSLLDEAALLPTQDTFAGVRWMTTMTEALWSGNSRSDWSEQYQELVKLLYDIGFLGVRGLARDLHYSYTDIGFCDSLVNLAEASSFVVHPAYRAALDVVSRRVQAGGAS
ncbi:MAG: P-loop ATPase, Sll1717 family, partial [Acidimicrobiales bacterium]